MTPRQPTEIEINQWLNAIFTPAALGKENQYYDQAVVAFENLTCCFVQRRFRSTPKLAQKVLKCIRFDYVAIISMLKRFQRDAFGVKRFCELTGRMVRDREFSQATREKIMAEVFSLGLRITAESPRKTRETAVFSLWMCVFRPISFDAEKLVEISPENLELFCAMVNFFIASSYLGKYGDIDLGQTAHEVEIRTERIKHDFTCREINLSSLEIFYGAIFKLYPEYVENENVTVKTSSFIKRKKT